jgi:hypothetical protein
VRALILAAVIACDPRGVPASQTPYARDVAVVRAEWAADDTLPIDTCGEPRIAFDDVDASLFLGGDTLVIDDALDEPAAHVAVRHETVHWLALCTDHDDTADRWHRDTRLWWTGVLGRAEVLQ